MLVSKQLTENRVRYDHPERTSGTYVSTDQSAADNGRAVVGGAGPDAGGECDGQRGSATLGLGGHGRLRGVAAQLTSGHPAGHQNNSGRASATRNTSPR